MTDTTKTAKEILFEEYIGENKKTWSTAIIIYATAVPVTHIDEQIESFRHEHATNLTGFVMAEKTFLFLFAEGPLAELEPLLNHIKSCSKTTNYPAFHTKVLRYQDEKNFSFFDGWQRFLNYDFKAIRGERLSTTDTSGHHKVHLLNLIWGLYLELLETRNKTTKPISTFGEDKITSLRMKVGEIWAFINDTNQNVAASVLWTVDQFSELIDGTWTVPTTETERGTLGLCVPYVGRPL